MTTTTPVFTTTEAATTTATITTTVKLTTTAAPDVVTGTYSLTMSNRPSCCPKIVLCVLRVYLLARTALGVDDISCIIGSRPSDHYFRSVCLSVCLFVCAEFFSAVFDPISIKLGHMLCVWV